MKKKDIVIILLTMITLIIAGGIFLIHRQLHRNKNTAAAVHTTSVLKQEWIAPDTNLIPHTAEGELIRYGRKLIVNTSFYFGPRGSINRHANGMNCQNCHLDAGTRIFSNPFNGVASLFPRYSPRSGLLESVQFKINECMERSLNGDKIDSADLEMKSMTAYLKWVGNGIPRGTKPWGTGTAELPLMHRAADTAKGKIIFQLKCQTCHGINGEGLLSSDKTGYTYPPLWGDNSYTISAGMYRISKLAEYVKYAMPLQTKYPNPQLKDEEAWDVAAFINSRPHPVKIFKRDWPKLKNKPFDYPFGPYADSLSQQQHKFGPYAKQSSFLRE